MRFKGQAEGWVGVHAYSGYSNKAHGKGVACRLVKFLIQEKEQK